MAFTLLEKQTGIYRGYEPCADGSAVLESGMNNYWQQRSSSYSDQNMAQLFSEKRTAWENLIFYHGNEKKNMNILDIVTNNVGFQIYNSKFK